MGLSPPPPPVPSGLCATVAGSRDTLREMATGVVTQTICTPFLAFIWPAASCSTKTQPSTPRRPKQHTATVASLFALALLKGSLSRASVRSVGAYVPRR